MEESFREMRGHALESSSLSSPFLDGIYALRGSFDGEANQSGFANNIFTLHFPNLFRLAEAFSFFSLFPPLQPSLFSFLPLSTSSSPFFFSPYLFPPDPLSLFNLLSPSLYIFLIFLFFLKKPPLPCFKH